MYTIILIDIILLISNKTAPHQANLIWLDRVTYSLYQILFDGSFVNVVISDTLSVALLNRTFIKEPLLSGKKES